MAPTLRRIYFLRLLPFGTCWPIWQWYFTRWRDGSDDAVGIFALVIACGFLWYVSRQPATAFSPNWRWPAVAMIVYAASYPWLSPLPRAMIAISALLVTTRYCWLGNRLHAGLIGLCLLSLPLLASLQFYLGYPLRLASARPTAVLLRMGGLIVFNEGTALRWGEKLIEIDAPCSGIKMLWAGGLLVCTLALLYGLSWQRTLLAGLLGLPLIIGGNIWRATSLFYLEAGLIQLPAWAHTGIGLAAFTITSLSLVAMIQWLASVKSAVSSPPTHHNKTFISTVQSQHMQWLFGSACIAAALIPLLPSHNQPIDSHDFPGWPTTFEGQMLTTLPLTERELRFAEDFPGKIGRFHDGAREIVLRWVTRETRKLHSAADCFQGLGYRITPLPLQNNADGTRWQSFIAQRKRENLRISERIYETHGTQSWSDVSAWYWQATLKRTTGNWWAVTVAEVIEQNSSL